MPKTYPVKNNFTRGQFSPLLHDSTDEPIYQNGAKELTNGFVLPHGGFTRRGGTRYAGLTKNVTGNVNLEPFIFSDNPKQSYVLEWGDRYLRFFWGGDKLPIIDPDSLDPLPKFAFSGIGVNDVTITGEYTGAENSYFKIEVIGKAEGEEEFDIFKFSKNGEEVWTFIPGEDEETEYVYGGLTITFDTLIGHTIGDYWETEVYWPYQLPTPYPESVVNDLWLVQKEDVVFVFHQDYVPRKLSRCGHTDWQLEPWVPSKSPWVPSIGLQYDFYNIDGTRSKGTASKGALDYQFSVNSGAVLLKSGKLESSIAFSLDNTYYSEVDNELRLALLNVATQYTSIEIYGNIYIPEDGDYQFALNSGYWGSDLLIDGDVIAKLYGNNVDPLNPSGGTFQASLLSRAGTVTLTSGEHTIRVRFALGTTLRTGAVYWKQPGESTFEIIPAKYFSGLPDRYGVTTAIYKKFDLAGSVTLPPADQTAFNALFSTSTTGVTLAKTGQWDDRIGFHSQSVTGEFSADLPPNFIADSTSHALEIAGYLTVEETGNYQFAVDGNDGIEFVLFDESDNQLAQAVWLSNINTQAQADGYTEWKSSSWAKHVSSVVALTAGVYKFRARYWSELKGFAVSVAWKTPGESDFVLIPQASMTPAAGYYPRCGTFHEQRMFFGGLKEEPQTVYASKTFDIEDFETGADADDGLKFRISANQVDAIQWMISKDALYIGTVSTEYLVRGSNGVIIPDDIDVKPNTSYGSAAIRPIQGEDSFYFVRRSERGLREYTYVLERDKSVGINIDILGEDLFHDGIQKLVFQQGGNAAFRFGFPDINANIINSGKQIADPINTPFDLNLLWVLTQTGELRTFTVEQLEKVFAWSTQTLGGTDVIIDSITQIPGDGGDILFLAVRRTIDGSTVRTIEWIDPLNLCDLGYVNSQTGSSSGVCSISLTHLPNEEIQAVGIMIDASGLVTWELLYDRHNPLSPTSNLTLNENGQIDFNDALLYWKNQTPWLYRRYQAIFAGYAFYNTIETLPFDVQIGQQMTSLSMLKRWMDIWLSTVNTTGAKMALAAYPDDTEAMDDEGALVTGRNRFLIPGWDRESSVRVTQDAPFPLTIRSIYGEMQVNTG